MTDNGGVTGVKLYNAGMRGGKTSLYDGGHRVPCFIRWPAGGFAHGRDVTAQTQTQDILPTLAELCGLQAPAVDGASLAPLLRGRTIADRMLVAQYYQNSLKREHAAIIWNQWRLVDMRELYDIGADPGQLSNVAVANQEVVDRMRAYHDKWWQTVEPRLSDPVPSVIGSRGAMLCCSEWWDVRADGQPSVRTGRGGPRGGPWHIDVEREGRYRVELRRWPRDAELPLRAGAAAFRAVEGTLPEGKALPIASASLRVGGEELQAKVGEQDKAAVFHAQLKAGRTQLHGWFSDASGQDVCGAYFAYVAL
jgi:arylsulfatase